MNARPDVRQDITNRVLAYIDSGTVPWRKAWTSASSRPINAKTQKPYSGINSLILGMAIFDNATYANDNRFVTAVQSNDLGLRIRKGEHAAARIIRMVEVDRHKAEKQSEGEVVAEENGKCLVMKTYAVFHASQLEPGLPPIVKVKTSIAPVAAVEAIVNAMKDTGLKIAEGPFEPVYMPKLDLIRIPPLDSFHGIDADDVAANRCGTLLHEISHAVGAPKRLARFGMTQMSLRERAIEELVAEWSATLLCSDIKSIKLGENHCPYCVQCVGQIPACWADFPQTPKHFYPDEAELLWLPILQPVRMSHFSPLHRKSYPSLAFSGKNQTSHTSARFC